MARRLNGTRAARVIINCDGFNGREDENLSIADAALSSRSRDSADRLYRFLHEIIIDHNFKPYLAEQMDLVLNAAVKGRMTFLATVTLGIYYGQSMDSDLVQSFTDGL